jgi:hypothetical protein
LIVASRFVGWAIESILRCTPVTLLVGRGTHWGVWEKGGDGQLDSVVVEMVRVRCRWVQEKEGPARVEDGDQRQDVKCVGSEC